MYTRTYPLDSAKYPTSMDQVRSALMTLNGVTEVDIIHSENALVVHFHNPLSEKQILSMINQYKRRH